MEGLVRVFELIQKTALFKEQLCLKKGKSGKNGVELLSMPEIWLLFCEAFERGCCLSFHIVSWSH